jgi:mono/diheme cytochrome c family protein
MMFIQEYGLGRLICPRPNWSGVYRTDEWLMTHFRNPASLVPRSLMPTFPFDDTKFYALTYLLDVFGVRNRDADRAVWDHNGFNPSRAFAMYCSQCHGDSRQGNGPVAEWIYPIPKNLSSAEFLRNLTKENAIMSIHHGVKGTPMPPWGDVGQDKPLAVQGAVQTLSHDKPIFTQSEIKHLVDWLFSLLPQGEVLKDSDVMKWEYTPEDAIKELKQEGNAANLKSEAEKQSGHKKEDVADHNPLFPMTAAVDLQVGDLFDKVDNKVPDEPGMLYYIKKKYYTEHHIKEGQKFFLTNCAVCHGSEGDGTGIRAGTMSEAKPQMLNNLNWIRTRDDLRLLRSIKYGIPGTAMTPWGDFTTSLLRTQLVIFIRTLTQEQDQRDKLRMALYEAFATAWQTIDAGRLKQSRLIEKHQQQFDKALANYQQTTAQAEKGAAPLVDAVKAYELYLSEGVNLRREQAVDQKLIDLKIAIEKEKEMYEKIGIDLINTSLGDETLDLLLQMIALNKNRFALDEDKLVVHETSRIDQKKESLAKQIIEILNKKIAQLEKNRLSVEGKEIDGEINTYTSLKIKIEQNTKEAAAALLGSNSL